MLGWGKCREGRNSHAHYGMLNHSAKFIWACLGPSLPRGGECQSNRGTHTHLLDLNRCCSTDHASSNASSLDQVTSTAGCVSGGRSNDADDYTSLVCRSCDAASPSPSCLVHSIARVTHNSTPRTRWLKRSCRLRLRLTKRRAYVLSPPLARTRNIDTRIS